MDQGPYPLVHTLDARVGTLFATLYHYCTGNYRPLQQRTVPYVLGVAAQLNLKTTVARLSRPLTSASALAEANSSYVVFIMCQLSIAILSHLRRV